MDKILIVEDEPLELSMLEEILSETGYSTVTASDGLQARDLLRKSIPGLKLVVLDWVMPGMNGIQLLEWIRTRPDLEHVEAIIQSGRISSADVREGLRAGACFYLRKPYDPSQLEAVVRAAIINSNLRSMLAEKIRQAQDVFRLLASGLFEFRTLEEAESLAAGLAVGCGYRDGGIGLFEIFSNAVEHGNLGISYEEKGLLLEEGRFEEEVKARLSSPAHRDKKVVVQAERKGRELHVLVTDMGEGFRFEEYLDFDQSRMFDSHGRGILLASSLLNLEYLEPGNRVKVVIPVEETPHVGGRAGPPEDANS